MINLTKKYCHHMASMNYTAIMLNGHIDPTFYTHLAKYNQLQQVCHILLTNMCQNKYVLKCHIYAYYFLCRYDTTMSVYILHISSLQSKLQPGALLEIHFTLFAYAPKQICLSHHTFMFHCINTVFYMQIPHYWRCK